MANDIDRLIEEFTNNLTTLVRRTTLEEVLANLQGGMGGAVRRGPGRPKGSGAKRGRPFGSKNKTAGRRRSSENEEMRPPSRM
jgi:hypothetical protein